MDLNEYRIMFLKHYFHRSAPVYSLTLPQAHTGRETTTLSSLEAMNQSYILLLH